MLTFKEGLVEHAEKQMKQVLLGFKKEKIPFNF